MIVTYTETVTHTVSVDAAAYRAAQNGDGDLADLLNGPSVKSLDYATSDLYIVDEELEDDDEDEDDDPVVESPSGWSYRESQENGDRVDCANCGRPLDDDEPIVNDSEDFAYHRACLPTVDGAEHA